MGDDDTKTQWIAPIYESKCVGSAPDSTLQDSTTEFQLSFVYGVEYTTSNHDSFINDMEDWILYYVASSSLKCFGGNHQQQSSLLRGEVDEIGAAGVTKILYPSDDGDITSTITCDPISAQAQGCSIFNTRMLVTSVGVPIHNVRNKILAVLADALNNGTFVEYIPEIVTTAYLGPEVEAVLDKNAHGTSNQPIAAGIMIGILIAFMAVIPLLVGVAIRRHLRRERVSSRSARMTTMPLSRSE
eukprot:scaffold1880_cov207-Alexandrium_tamarense.AAC.3